MNYQVWLLTYDLAEFTPRKWTDNPTYAKAYVNATSGDLATYEDCLEFVRGFNEGAMEANSGFWAVLIGAEQQLFPGANVEVAGNFKTN